MAPEVSTLDHREDRRTDVWRQRGTHQRETKSEHPRAEADNIDKSTHNETGHSCVSLTE